MVCLNVVGNRGWQGQVANAQDAGGYEKKCKQAKSPQWPAHPACQSQEWGKQQEHYQQQQNQGVALFLQCMQSHLQNHMVNQILMPQTLTDKCIILPKIVFDGPCPTLARAHWVVFEKDKES